MNESIVSSVDTKCDTQRLHEDCRNIYNELTEYEDHIEKFFKLIQDLQNNSDWIGQDAKLYVALAMEDKQNYLDYGKRYQELIQKMINFSDELETKIRSVESESII